MIRFLRSFVIAVALVVAVTPLHAADTSLDFESAKAQAAERGVPVVIDFFTDWCVYCKHFDRDLADASTGLADALGAVVFTSIDAEKGEGIELAKTYEVSGFPTYLMIDAEGEVIDRWAGYGGPDHFRQYYDPALADPRPLHVKREAFEKEPTAELAIRFGEIEMGAGRSDEAIAYFRQAQELDPSSDQSGNILMANFMKVRRTGTPESFQTFTAAAQALIDDEDTATGTIATAAQMVGALAGRFGEPELELTFLKAALDAIERDPADVDPSQITAIKIAGHLKVTGDVDKAVAAKKASLDEGWEDDADALNGFAWWCFENEVNLEEAQALAMKGVELARPGTQKAMILDTLAEICNARGDCGEALAFIEQAIEEAPDERHYLEQRTRFSAALAKQNAGE